MNIQELKNILVEAQNAAAAKSMEMYTQHGDGWACGFAWVNIYKHEGKAIKGNTKLGKLLKQAGVRQDYTRAFQVWGGEWYNGQSIDIKEAGARAYADVLKRYVFEAYAGSRLD